MNWNTWQTSGQDVIWRERFDKTDFQALGEEIKRGFEVAFSEENLAKSFDPKKNGVEEAFRKFGANTEEAFKDLGQRMEKAFDPNQNGVASEMKKFGDKLGVALQDPDTWIMIIGSVASVAALVLSGGTAGPLVVAALGALGPSMNIIGAVARGRPVDPLDIASMALAIIPGVGAAVGGLDDAVRAGVTATKVATPAARSAALGKVLADATTAANRVGNAAIRSGLIAKLDKVAHLASSVQSAGNKVRFIYRNPGSIKTLLKSPAIANEVPIVLTNAEKAKKYGEMGLHVVKAGVSIAKVGEKTDLWQVPDILVPLDTINWDNPPDDLQYVFELPTDDKSQASAREREAFLERQRLAKADYDRRVKEAEEMNKEIARVRGIEAEDRRRELLAIQGGPALPSVAQEERDRQTQELVNRQLALDRQTAERQQEEQRQTSIRDARNNYFRYLTGETDIPPSAWGVLTPEQRNEVELDVEESVVYPAKTSYYWSLMGRSQTPQGWSTDPSSYEFLTPQQKKEVEEEAKADGWVPPRKETPAEKAQREEREYQNAVQVLQRVGAYNPLLSRQQVLDNAKLFGGRRVKGTKKNRR